MTNPEANIGAGYVYPGDRYARPAKNHTRRDSGASYIASNMLVHGTVSIKTEPRERIHDIK